METDFKSMETVKRWLEEGSERSQREKLRWLKLYCQHMGLTPDEIIAQRKADLRSDDDFTQRRHEEMLRRFGKAMRNRCVWFNSERPIAETTITTGIGFIRGFYAANYQDLRRVRGFGSAAPQKVYHIPDQKELGLMVKAVEDEHKAVILGLAQSGLSTDDFLMLHRLHHHSQKFGSLGRQLESGANLLHIHITRGKTRAGRFDAFFGRAAAEAFRKLEGSGYLIRPDRERVKFDSVARDVRRIVARAAADAGIEGIVSPHCLRKFFTTQLKLARVNDPFFSDALIEYWTGHSLGKVKGAYFIPPLERQIELYREAEPRITPL